MDIRAVFAFEGYDLSVYPTIAAAEWSTEVYDLGVRSYFTDGTVLSAHADDYRVRLSPTVERRPDELRDRLRSCLEKSGLGIDRLSPTIRSPRDKPC